MAIISALAALAGGCADAAARDGGYATLDALRDAQAACSAQGGTLQLKPQGDSSVMGDYACVRK